MAGRAGAEVSKKTNKYKKPVVYWNVCEMQKQWGAPENEQMDEDANGKTWNEWTDTIMAEWDTK